MNPEDEDSDKQFEASERKLEEARKKGEIARSADLITAAGYTGFLLALLTLGPAALLGFADAMTAVLARAEPLAEDVFAGGGGAFLGALLRELLTGTLIWFALPFVLALLCVALQRAFLFTPSKIAPKLNRISPISGVKNKFGRQGLFEFAKSSVKLVIYTVIMGFFLIAQIEPIIGSLQLPPRLILVELGQMITVLLAIVLCVSFALGGIDYLWQAAEHRRKNRMSRKELMDELKQSEGDPLMKQQRRARAQDLAMNRMLVDVAGADVVVVNPTHFAVALKWDKQQGTAPVCVAKGADEIAARIREQAQIHRVPIHADPPTARALFAEVDIGAEIAPAHYQAVAAAIRFAEAMRAKARGRSWT